MRQGTKVAVLSFGARLYECMTAAEELTAMGLSTTVADARFAKPLDGDLVKRLAKEHEVLITIEEGAAGGFGAQVLHFLATERILDNGVKIRPMVMPDVFLDQDKPYNQYETAELNARHVISTALQALGREVTELTATLRA